jgi:V-type H+-transporting ATPase subunit C
MPSDLAYWLISAPLKEGDPNVLLEDVRRALPGTSVAGWEVPELKVCSVDSSRIGFAGDVPA